MKAFIILTAVLVTVAALSLSENEEQQWQDFKVTYGKNYASEEEEKLRKETFAENLRQFREHNRKYEKGILSYTMGVNQFADMTQEEFVHTLAPLPAPSSGGLPFIPRAGVKAPATKDWRENGAVTAPKDQKTCGSCYAFSATGALEGHLLIKKGNLLSLSEQNLVDCSQNAGNNGCNGGHPTQCFKYVQTNGGINPEESYPYENKVGQCRYNPQIPGGTASSFVTLNTENDLLEAVGTIGPVSVGVNAKLLLTYSGGILDAPSEQHLNHAVLVVGYGTSANGIPYWIVKNSWGAGWGENGYIRIVRNKGQCGIGSDGSYPII